MIYKLTRDRGLNLYIFEPLIGIKLVYPRFTHPHNIVPSPENLKRHFQGSELKVVF